MTEEPSAEPLHALLRSIRQPASLRELMAACLRSIYMGDPFSGQDETLPALPENLLEEVVMTQRTFSGIRCQLYVPKKATKKLPLVLYMHGGGFVIGCSEDTDYITRMLCHSNQVAVVSLNYRLAPETVFPGALIDCGQVLDAVIGDGDELGIDDSCLYLAGDSAGANLAIALYSRLQQHKAAVKGLILLAPWLDMEVEQYESYNRLAPTGIVFDAAFMGYARAAYVGFEQWKDPHVSPLIGAIADLPPTIVLIGSEDPLVDQSRSLRQKAIDCGCEQIEVVIYPGMPHCFYSFPSLFKEELECYRRVSEFMKEMSGL